MQKFELGEYNSRLCELRTHVGCAGFKRTWYGPVVTPWWPYYTQYDQPCECSCHNSLDHKPRLAKLIGPRENREPKASEFEARS